VSELIIFVILMISWIVFISILPFLRNIYVFWIIVSLFNFRLLGGLVIPPLLIVSHSYYEKFLPFLLPPLIFALLIAVVVAVCAVLAVPWFRTSSFGKKSLPQLFNLVLLTAFLFAAEHYKSTLIAKALTNHSPDCISINSFLSSLSFGGQELGGAHAIFTEKGKTFFWSYSTLDFFEGKEDLSINFPCHQSK